MENETEGILKEYDSLRQEIRTTESSILQLLTLMLGATGAIMVGGFTSNNPGVFVIPIVLMLLTCYYVADKRWVIWLIAGYLLVFLEKESRGLMWETRLSHYREIGEELPWKSPKFKIFRPTHSVLFVEKWMFIAIGAINLSLVLYFTAIALFDPNESKAMQGIGQNPLSPQLIVIKQYAFILAAILSVILFAVLCYSSSYNFKRLKNAKTDSSNVIEQWRETKKREGKDKGGGEAQATEQPSSAEPIKQ